MRATLDGFTPKVPDEVEGIMELQQEEKQRRQEKQRQQRRRQQRQLDLPGLKPRFFFRRLLDYCHAHPL